MSLPYQIVEVVTPATNFSLTTVANVRSALNFTDTSTTDDQIDQLIKQCSSAIARRCNRVFAVQEYAEASRGSGTIFSSFTGYTGAQSVSSRANALLLSRAPVVEVSALSECGTVLAEGTDFELSSADGLLYRLDGSGYPQNWDRSNITAVYRAGWLLPDEEADDDDESPPSELPSDIEDACIRMVKARLLARDRDPYLRRDEVVGVGSQEFWIDTGSSGNCPPDVADILDRYRNYSMM
jgi:hypothetical protein